MIGPIYTIADIFEDPQYQARETITTVDDPILGRARVQNAIPRLVDTPGVVRHLGGDAGPGQRRRPGARARALPRGPGTAGPRRASSVATMRASAGTGARMEPHDGRSAGDRRRTDGRADDTRALSEQAETAPMATLKDVARLAEVDPSTVVARAARRPEPGRPTRDARADHRPRRGTLRYRPNALARGLRTRRTDTIGLIIPSLENLGFSEVTHGIQAAAAAGRQARRGGRGRSAPRG